MSKTLNHLVLSLSTGMLLGLSWPTQGLTLLIFGALVPLLYVEESIRKDTGKRKGLRLFCFSYLSFLTWNLITTWWLFNSTLFGMLFANLCNSLFLRSYFSSLLLGQRKVAPSQRSYFSSKPLVGF